MFGDSFKYAGLCEQQIRQVMSQETIPEAKSGFTHGNGRSKRVQEVKSRIRQHENSRRHGKRSRQGCDKCKLGRIKCDEAKPKCTRCRQKNYDCNYKMSLSFREDYEKKGLMFGREGAGSRHDRKSSSSVALDNKSTNFVDIRHQSDVLFFNLHSEDFENFTGYMGPTIQPSIFPPEVVYAVNDVNLASVSLSYYVEFVSPQFNPLGDGETIFYLAQGGKVSNINLHGGLSIPMLTKFSQRHTHIWYLVLALGSIFLFKRNGSSEWRDRSQTYKFLGLKSIKKSIASLGDSSFPKNDTSYGVDILFSFVLLMLYEVTNDCNEKFRLYMKLSKSLLASSNFKSHNSSLESFITLFSLQMLHHHETMGRTACREKNSYFLASYENANESVNESASEGVNENTNADDSEKEEHVEHFLQNGKPVQLYVSWAGCDWRLVDVVSDITDLSIEKTHGDLPSKVLELSCKSMKNKLRELSTGVSLRNLMSARSFRRLDNSIVVTSEPIMAMHVIGSQESLFLLACEIKRISTFIYMECALLNGTPEDYSIKRLVHEVYEALEYLILHNDVKWVSSLLWPLFIVSAELSVSDPECDEYRYLTLKMLQRIYKMGVGSASMTIAVISRVWKARDLGTCNQGVIKTTENKGDTQEVKKVHNVRNDWEKYVANESFRVVFA